jgi:hypothetical protein
VRGLLRAHARWFLGFWGPRTNLKAEAPLYTIEQSISLESREENKSSPIRPSFSSLVATL